MRIMYFPFDFSRFRPSAFVPGLSLSLKQDFSPLDFRYSASYNQLAKKLFKIRHKNWVTLIKT
jgi:hypothetical protein